MCTLSNNQGNASETTVDTIRTCHTDQMTKFHYPSSRITTSEGINWLPDFDFCFSFLDVLNWGITRIVWNAQILSVQLINLLPTYTQVTITHIKAWNLYRTLYASVMLFPLYTSLLGVTVILTDFLTFILPVVELHIRFGLFPSTWYLCDSPMWSHGAIVQPSVLLSSIPWYGYTAFVSPFSCWLVFELFLVWGLMNTSAVTILDVKYSSSGDLWSCRCVSSMTQRFYS